MEKYALLARILADMMENYLFEQILQMLKPLQLKKHDHES